MKIFCYKALNAQEKKVNGIIDAESEQEALSILQRKQLLIISLKVLKKEKKGSSFPLKEKILFFHSLARLLEAGLPLYEALVTIRERETKLETRLVITDLCNQIKMGKSLSFALSTQEKNFDPLISSMVATGESSGSLEKVLFEISELLSKQFNIKKQVISALIYPSLLFGFCFVLLSILFFFVIPSLSEIFEGRKLHPLTQVVLSLSLFVRSNIFVLLALFFIFLLFIVYFLSNRERKKKLFSVFYFFPILDKIFYQSALIRFCRSFASLVSSKVEYPLALQLASSVMAHPFLEKEIAKRSSQLIEGKKLSHIFRDIEGFPSIFIQMIAIGEEGGEMAKMLYFLAKLFEDDLEKTLLRLTTLIQPLLLVVLGAIIGLVVLSVLLPLTDVSSFGA